MVAVLNPDFAAAGKQLFGLDEPRLVARGPCGLFVGVAIISVGWFRWHAAAFGNCCATMPACLRIFASVDLSVVIREFCGMRSAAITWQQR